MIIKDLTECKEIDMSAVHGGEGGFSVAKLELTSGQMSHVAGGSSDLPTENISLNFTKIEIRY